MVPINLAKIEEYQKALKQEKDTGKRAELKESIKNEMSMNKNPMDFEMHCDEIEIRPREISRIEEAISKKISKENLKLNPLSVLIVVYRTKDYCYCSEEVLDRTEQLGLQEFCLKNNVFDYYPKVCLVHYKGQEYDPHIDPIVFSKPTS